MLTAHTHSQARFVVYDHAKLCRHLAKLAHDLRHLAGRDEQVVVVVGTATLLKPQDVVLFHPQFAQHTGRLSHALHVMRRNCGADDGGEADIDEVADTLDSAFESARPSHHLVQLSIGSIDRDLYVEPPRLVEIVRGIAVNLAGHLGKAGEDALVEEGSVGQEYQFRV